MFKKKKDIKYPLLESYNVMKEDIKQYKKLRNGNPCCYKNLGDFMERKTEEILKYPIEKTERLKHKLSSCSIRTDKLITGVLPMMVAIFICLFSILTSIYKEITLFTVISVSIFLILYISACCGNLMFEIEYYNSLLEVISAIETIRGYNFKQQLIEKYTSKRKIHRKDINSCTQAVSLPTSHATAAYQRRTKSRTTRLTSRKSALRHFARRRAGANRRCSSTRDSRAGISTDLRCEIFSRT